MRQPYAYLVPSPPQPELSYRLYMCTCAIHVMLVYNTNNTVTARTRNIVEAVQCSPKCGHSFNICIYILVVRKKLVTKNVGSVQRCAFKHFLTNPQIRKSANSWARSATANQIIYYVSVSVNKIANSHIFILYPQIANLKISTKYCTILSQNIP